MSKDANKGYQFTVINGAVTAVYEVKNGRVKFEKMDRDETWSVDGANIVKSEIEHGRIETTTYTDINGDGIFAKMSKSYETGGILLSSSTSQTVTLQSTLQNDDLYGAGGDDILIGGAGADDLHGGPGKDTFKYNTIFESGLSIDARDRIHDFTAGDKIDLSTIDAKSGNWTNDAFTYVGTAANVTKANANGAVWFENGILYGSNDRDTAAEFQMELVGVTAMSAADLIL